MFKNLVSERDYENTNNGDELNSDWLLSETKAEYFYKNQNIIYIENKIVL